MTQVDRQKTRGPRGTACLLLVIVLAASLFGRSAAQQPAPDVSKEAARPTRDWVRDGLIYEIYPRDFSQEGNFNGITAQLDRLKDLGVTILRSEEHTSELQSRPHLVCRLLLEKKKTTVC